MCVTVVSSSWRECWESLLSVESLYVASVRMSVRYCGTACQVQRIHVCQNKTNNSHFDFFGYSKWYSKDDTAHTGDSGPLGLNIGYNASAAQRRYHRFGPESRNIMIAYTGDEAKTTGIRSDALISKYYSSLICPVLIQLSSLALWHIIFYFRFRSKCWDIASWLWPYGAKHGNWTECLHCKNMCV